MSVVSLYKIVDLWSSICNGVSLGCFTIKRAQHFILGTSRGCCGTKRFRGFWGQSAPISSVQVTLYETWMRQLYLIRVSGSRKLSCHGLTYYISSKGNVPGTSSCRIPGMVKYKGVTQHHPLAPPQKTLQDNTVFIPLLPLFEPLILLHSVAKAPPNQTQLDALAWFGSIRPVWLGNPELSIQADITPSSF